MKGGKRSKIYIQTRKIDLFKKYQQKFNHKIKSMRNKFVIASVFACLVLIICLEFDINFLSKKTSILLIKNIEALASGENTGSYPTRQEYPIVCGAIIPGTKKMCKEIIITCQGTGKGCTPTVCSIHKQ